MNRALRVAQTFDGAAEFHVGGDYFKLLEAADAVTVELLYQGSQVLYAENAQAGFYQHARFDLVKITNPVSQAIAFLAASARGGSDRFSGDVDLIDQATRLVGKVQQFKDPTTVAGEAFNNWLFPAAAGGSYTWCQVRNPSGSGKVVYVDGIDAFHGAGSAQYFQVGVHNTAMSTLNGTLNNLDAAAPASTAQLRHENRAAGATPDYPLRYFVCPTGDIRPADFDPPIRLGEGEGAVVAIQATGVSYGVSFRIREVTA